MNLFFNKLISLLLTVTLFQQVTCKVKKSKGSSDASPEEIFKKISTYPTKEGVMYLKEDDFSKFIKTPRNYSLAVALTALGQQFDCGQCHEFDKSMRIVGQSWAKHADKDKLFLGVLDFENAQKTFMKYQLRGAPNLFFFPASETPSSDPKYEEYQIAVHGNEPEAFAKYLGDQIDAKIKIYKPINWSLYGTIATGVTVVGLAGYLIIPKLGKMFVQTNIWASLSLVFILMMVSGHMFNQIRSPSFMAQTKEGKVKIWHEGFQDQYSVESQIIALVYGVSSFAIVTLVNKVQPIKNETLKFALVTFLCALLLGTLLFISSIFYTKFPMYPFTLVK